MKLAESQLDFRPGFLIGLDVHKSNWTGCIRSKDHIDSQISHPKILTQDDPIPEMLKNLEKKGAIIRRLFSNLAGKKASDIFSNSTS